MADDIVTRLRERHANFPVVVGVNQNVVLVSLYSEAADEIERLRQQVDSLGKQLDRAVSRD